MAKLAIITEDQITPDSEANPLPFIPAERQRIGFGGYSTVYKEIIISRHFIHVQDQGHSTFWNEVSLIFICLFSQTSTTHLHRITKNPLPVARKRFPYHGDFEREYALLRYLKSARKPHERVLKHLAGVILENDSIPEIESCLLFPLADMHLEKFLTTSKLSNFDLNSLVDELFNLADALDYLHRGIQTSEGEQLVCLHMDLAPTNILIFNYNSDNSRHPVGIWKIADFSSSNLITGNGRPLLAPPILSAGAYVAPEIHQKIEALIGMPCDIWSFGCILFDVLLGHCFGGEGGLAVSKYYFEEGGRGDSIQIASDVSKYLDKSIFDTQITSFCKGIVSAVLKTDPTERPTAQIIKEKLALMVTT